MHKGRLLFIFLAVFGAGLYGAPNTLPPVLDIAQSVSLTVVVDPAHGGGDWGVSARGILEKDITLKAGKAIKQKLEKSDPYVNVLLTRNDDSFVPPAERAGLANNNKAVAFISLHCDYSANQLTEGYKVYYTAGVDAGARKNKAEVVEWSKVQDSHINESVRLASFISQYMQASLIPETGAAGNNEANSTVPGKYRKEKSAALVPLEGVDMPAVVIELGNLNNSNDASYLKDDKALNSIAYHIKEAMSYFLKDIK